MKYKLIVVTVTYKPLLSMLYAYVDSFIKYNDLGEQAKLVVVDNSPVQSWDAATFIRRYPMVAYIANPENPGFGAANNKGFESFDSDYVLFMNNDAEFTEPVFTKLIQTHEADAKIGCLGIHQTGGAPSFFKKMTAPTDVGVKEFVDQYHFISGSFMFFKSSAFIACGKFDPKLFMYFEEFDLSTRLIERGFCTKYISTLSFWHKVGSRKVISESTWKKSIPSFIYICKKYNLNPKYQSKPIMKRLRLLFTYNCLLFHFKEAKKIWNVYFYRRNLVYNEFGVKIW